MIAYKVVEKGTRFGSNVTIDKHENRNITPKERRRITTLRRKHKAWFPRYLKHTTVKMVRGSIGILAFDAFENADRFKKKYPSLYNHGQIIKVKVKGKLLPEARVILGCSKFEHLLGMLSSTTAPAPSGTIFCRAVEVLE